jgi:hypothetical protein
MDVNHSRLHESPSSSHSHASARHNVLDKTGDHGLPENHVRVVRIVPGCTEDLVLCKTRLFSLSMSPVYSAISYAWGPPVAEHAIVLDGRRRLVPKNLWHFLTTWRRHFALLFPNKSEPFRKFFARDPRSHKETSSAQYPSGTPYYYWLWIDALCIDQNNAKERDHQVKIMSRIFGGADEVFVWLGLACTKQDGWRFRYGTRIGELLDICDRVYWTRLWVFQELRSAKQVSFICGDEVTRFAELAKLLNNMAPDTAKREAESSRLFRQSVAARMVGLCGQNTPTSLWLLLQLTQHLHCYDPRDRVYALLSMAKSGHDGIDADYTMPLPELMHRVLRNLYSTSQPPCASDVAVRCARLKAMMGLEPGFPWGANDYLAAERLTHPSTDPA